MRVRHKEEAGGFVGLNKVNLTTGYLALTASLYETVRFN